jgi:hypothetical protein
MVASNCSTGRLRSVDVTSLDTRDPRESRYGLDYWLHRCQGFRVEAATGEIGIVRGLRFHGSIEPDQLEIASGLLGRRRRLVPVDQVEAIFPKKRLVVLSGKHRVVYRATELVSAAVRSR